MARPENELHLHLSAEGVPLSRLLDAQNAFLQLANEVARTVAETAETPATWVVSEIREGSLELVLRPEPNANVPIDVMPRIVTAIARGVASLQRRARRPPYFSDRALERAKDLAKLRGDKLPLIEVADEHVGTQLTDHLAANVDLLLGEPIQEIGTVEGYLEQVSLHGGQRLFAIFDPVSRLRIDCLIGHRIPAQEIGQALEKRVAVTGIIKYRSTGEIINVSARELVVFPSDDELPSADDVRGILA